ncbi:hypothetical protein EVAR_63476_1 [Eumeta japonica]|uniref:Uncharacterized protein n=1 Tax=Eumeta variegata TaxID=151549 RepID=A0A4C2AF35_EUMVA|nr:hypothetical protein EVAR_63476_1 [Eumeta japonica]
MRHGLAFPFKLKVGSGLADYIILTTYTIPYLVDAPVVYLTRSRLGASWRGCVEAAGGAAARCAGIDEYEYIEIRRSHRRRRCGGAPRRPAPTQQILVLICECLRRSTGTTLITTNVRRPPHDVLLGRGQGAPKERCKFIKKLENKVDYLSASDGGGDDCRADAGLERAACVNLF